MVYTVERCDLIEAVLDKPLSPRPRGILSFSLRPLRLCGKYSDSLVCGSAALRLSGSLRSRPPTDDYPPPSVLSLTLCALRYAAFAAYPVKLFRS